MDEMRPKVYLGTMNPVKIAAVKAVFEPLNYEVIAQEVASGVGKQPLSDDETMVGALNRTKSFPKNTIRIGLEAGIQQHGKTIFLVNWAVLVDENDRCFWAGGTRIPLPDLIKEAIFTKEMELSDAMDVYFKQKNIKYQAGAIGYFTNNYVLRQDIFEHLSRLLIGQYLKFKEEE